MGTVGTVQTIQVYIPCIRSNYDVLILNNEHTIISFKPYSYIYNIAVSISHLVSSIKEYKYNKVGYIAII